MQHKVQVANFSFIHFSFQALTNYKYANKTVISGNTTQIVKVIEKKFVGTASSPNILGKQEWKSYTRNVWPIFEHFMFVISVLP